MAIPDVTIDWAVRMIPWFDLLRRAFLWWWRITTHATRIGVLDGADTRRSLIRAARIDKGPQYAGAGVSV